MRAALTLLVVLASLALAACGGSSEGGTGSLGNQTLTVPSDVHGFYGELEAILAQFPYQRWYTKCLLRRVRNELDPAEAESLSFSEAQSEQAMEIVARAGPGCEQSTGRPAVDPNASSDEIAILRADYLPSIVDLAESEGLNPAQVACVEKRVENLPDQQVTAMTNGSHDVREGILLSVFKPCAKAR